jgi:hypothetical protein
MGKKKEKKKATAHMRSTVAHKIHRGQVVKRQGRKQLGPLCHGKKTAAAIVPGIWVHSTENHTQYHHERLQI